MQLVKKKRNSNIDLVKFICAFGVICIHTQSSNWQASLLSSFFSTLCVPFFLLSALVFFIAGLKTIDLPVVANKIWTRIVVPYLCWTLIYFLLILVKHFLTHQDSSNEWWKILFFGASAVQLYYIPKMIILQGFALAVILLFNQNYRSKFIGLAIFLISFIWLFIGIKNNCLGFSESDYIISSSYIILAFGIAKLMNEKRLNMYYAILGFALFVLLILLKYGSLDYLNTPDYASYFSVIGGLSLTLMAFSLPSISFSKKTMFILGFSYGIYLCHILFLEAFEFILKHQKIDLFYDFKIKFLFSICILCCSILFIFLIKRIPFLNKYLLGE